MESSRGKDEVIDSNEVQFSHEAKSVRTSSGDSSGQSRHKGMDNTNLVPTEKSCPGDQSFQCDPSAYASAKVDSNCNKQKESDHSDEAEKKCPGELSFQCAPSACAFAQVESNSDDKQKESDHSEEAEPLPIKLRNMKILLEIHRHVKQ